MNDNNITAAVSCVGVRKSFGQGEAAVEVLRGVDFQAIQGKLTFLVGPSGCGKTTLISVIAGLLDRTAGKVELFGRNIEDLSPKERIVFRRKNLGFVYQQFNLLPALTAAENAAVPLLAAGMPRAQAVARAKDLLVKLGLEHRLDVLPDKLSGGQQQRVTLARALVHEPRLIVCDEPTAALDHATGEAVMDLLSENAVHPERAVIVVTHDNRVFHYADAIAHMDDGQIVKTEQRAGADGNPAEVSQGNYALVAALATLLAGCMVGPDYRRPLVAVPSSYHQQLPTVTNKPSTDLSQWWRLFHDRQLDTLIQEAALANHDVRMAQARVREARAQQGLARSTLLPSVNASGDYSRQRLSQNIPNGFLARAAGQRLEQNFFDTGFDMNWELDVFGGNRRALEAAKDDLGRTIESGRGVLITVVGDVGLNYLDLRGLQKQLAVARDNLLLQEQTLDLTRDRFKAGLANELDTARAEAQAANTRSLIPLLEQDIQRSIHRLGILIGKEPAELESQLAPSAAIPAAIPDIPLGLPSDLLRRRPDIREAEREVAAATARIGVATADLFPRFFLTGSAGLQSLNASDFFDAGSRFWSLGPSVRWPIFTAGRIRQNIKVQNAREEQALIRYEQTVLTSLEEVENALISCGKEQEHHQSLIQSEAANRRAVELADERYRNGLVDFLNVLETQRSLLAVQDDLARSERTMDQNLVRLYKALGGGWEGDNQVAEFKPNAH